MTVKAKHQKLINFVNTFVKENGFAPTTAEIAEGTGSYYSKVQYEIQSLIFKGFLSRTPGKSRSLKVIKHPEAK